MSGIDSKKVLTVSDEYRQAITDELQELCLLAINPRADYHHRLGKQVESIIKSMEKAYELGRIQAE